MSPVVLRSTPEDFVVEEIPAYRPSGEGGHTFVWVEKRLRTTEEVARLLARAAGARPGDVGYAGRKDRFAVTRQYFSVPDLDPEAALAIEAEGVRVLEAARHPHKLRTGQLRGNRFEIVVRGVDEELSARAAARLEAAAAHGLPNRFGEQRFGRDGTNAEKGLAVLRGERPAGGRAPAGRDLRFLVSALQSAAFNEALRRRTLPLDAVEPGDVAMVHASGGVFLVEDPARENARAATGEISATGPIFGGRVLSPTGAPAERERAAIRSVGLDPDVPPRVPGLRLRGARRAIRMRPGDVHVAGSGDAVTIGFTLPSGSYATVLLEEVLGLGPAAPA